MPSGFRHCDRAFRNHSTRTQQNLISFRRDFRNAGDFVMHAGFRELIFFG